MSGTHSPGSGRVYEPVADIARGGMGRVELVVRREGSFARIYAMKRLRAELSEDRAVREMFLEEARIAGLIRHPNVVPVLDVGEDELGPYLVMEYVEGVAASLVLADATDADATLAVGFCAEVARQAAHGLEAAHDVLGAGGRRLSVVHGDVSPQNLLIGFDGLVRVTDFGVARALDRRPDGDGVVHGKVGYVSPEQLDGRAVDARSDLFSLGIVVYELLTSRRLYGGDRAEVFRRIRHEAALDVRRVRRDVPAELAGLLGELLEKSPDARPASAGEVAARLEEIVASLRTAGEDVSLAPFLRSSYAEEWRRQRALVASALERTEAGIPLLERSEADASAEAGPPPAEGGATTIRLAPRAAAPAGAPGAPPIAIYRRRPVQGTAAVVLVGLLGLVAWAGLRGDRTTRGGAGASGGCATTAECRATVGAASFCSPSAHRCESVLSPVCPELFPADARDVRNAIVLGTIFDRSTPNQLARERAARLAVGGLDQVGGIDGREVVLLHCDSSVSGAAAAADALVRAQVPAIVGPSTSAETESVFSMHATDGVLVISPSATATQVGDVDRGVPGLLWRTAPPDTLQAAVIVDDLRQPPRPARSVVVVRRSNDVYAQSLSVLVQEAATRAGIAVGPSELYARTEGIDGAAAAAIETGPDAVVFVSSRVDDAAAFLDATSRNGAYDHTALYLPDAAANDDLVLLARDGARRFPQVRATRPAPPSTIITSEFAAEYASAYGGENPLQFSFTAHTYDATALVLLGAGYAVRGGGALTGARIAEGIRLVSRGTHEYRLLGANLPATIAALRAPHPDVNVLGASGPLDYDASTEELTSADYEILGLRGSPPRFQVLRTAAAMP